MMAAMMLPGAVPAVARLASAEARFRAVPLFVTLYLVLWAVISLLVYELYRPHGYVAAGVATIAAGFYELTPLKAYFRHRCQQNARSGLVFGLCCVGSTAGLMAMFLALGVMNVTWMAVVAGVVVVQKTLPTKAALDVPLAFAIVSLGIFVLVAPSAVSRLAISM